MRNRHRGDKRAREIDKAKRKREKREKKAARRRAKEAKSGPSVDAEGNPILPIGAPIDLPDVTLDAISPDGVAVRTNGSPRPPLKLFIGGLNRSTETADLRQAFEAHGPVTEARVIHDRETGQSRGFGFVTYADGHDGEKALDVMDGAELDTHNIRVRRAEGS